jgi:hypothetical protein
MKSWQIIPIEFRERLADFGNQGDSSSWGIGDVACELADILTMAGEKGHRFLIGPEEEKLPIQELWNLIGEECGRSGQTIRGYEMYSRRVPANIRMEYDMLNRTQHKYLSDKSAGDLQVHKQLADDWLLNCDDWGGNVGSVNGMRAWMAGGDPEPKWPGRLRRAVDLTDKLQADKEAPMEVRARSGVYSREMGKWLKSE